MNNEKENIVPELRFPEFEKDGEWEITTIGEIGSFYYGKSAPKWSLSEDAPTLCVRYGELYTKFGTIINKIHSRTNIDPKTLRFSKGGEILVPRVGEDPFAFSNCSYLPFPNIAIGEMISVYETEQDSVFYTYYFNTLSKQFARVVEGQNVKNLYYVNLEPIKIGKPKSKLEQQKIANCLSSLEELINKEIEKLDLLKAHKKSLLQHLFPTKGETKPIYRFPEFKNDMNWSLKPISELSNKVTSGGTPSTKNKKFWGGDIRWMNSGELNLKIVNEVEGRITKEGLKNSSTKLIPIGCVLIGLAGQGKTRGTVAINKVELCTNQSIASIYPNEKKFDSKYLYHNLDKRYNELRELSTGGEGRGGLNLKIIRELDIPIPKNLKEQQKIANCLTSADDLIEKQVEKIKALKKHKKGLMQQLFPNVNRLAI